MQKDSSFEHDEVRHPFHSTCRWSSVTHTGGDVLTLEDYHQKPETVILTMGFRVFDVCVPKFICPIKHSCEYIVLP